MTRHRLGICLPGLLLTGCQILGVNDSAPELLLERYTNEHSRFFEAGGTCVHVRAEGQGPAILMLHGSLDSLHSWDRWAEGLRERYRVIRIDIPPFGLSAARPDRDYEPERIVPLLNEVLDAHGAASAVVVGNSLGGYFAAYYAAHAPERVEALALVTPAAYPQSLSLLVRFAAAPVIGKLFEWMTPLPLVRAAMGKLYGDPQRLSEHDVRRRFELLRAPGNREAARDVIRLMVRKAREEPAWIQRIDQPVLLLWGEDDHWMPYRLAQYWMDDLDDSVRLVIFPAAGHLAMEEIPDESLAAFQQFLSEVGSDRRNHLFSNNPTSPADHLPPLECISSSNDVQEPLKGAPPR